MGSRSVRALIALAVISLVVTGVGGSVAEAAADDLLTHAGRSRLLVASGIDPATAVVQVGPRLYAGPIEGCPAGFDCVDPASAPVLQVATSDLRGPGFALAKCSGSGGATDVDPGNDCSITQVVPSGAAADLSASCTHGSPDAPVSAAAGTSSLERSCTVSQDNDSPGGDNSVTVSVYLLQRVVRNGGTGAHVTDQSAFAWADITQSARGDGTNTATVVLSTDQRAESKNIPAAVVNDQEGRVSTSLEQTGEADNTGSITHRILQKADARVGVVGPITQRQNARDDGEVDSFAFVRQYSTSGDSNVGFNNLNLDMGETLRGDGTSSAAKDVTLLQGAPSGGLVGDIDGDADGVPPSGSTISTAPGSSFRAKISKEFKQFAQTAAGGVMTLVGDDVIDCCDLPFGFSDSYDFCALDFDALMAQSPVQSQKVTMRGTAEVDEACDATFDGATNQSSFSESVSGDRIAFSADCQDATCSTSDAPSAQDVAASGDEDSIISWQPSVSDPEGEALTCQEWVDDPPIAQHGEVSVSSDCGPSTYTPDPDFSGTDSFRYVARDPGGLFSERATVTITVNPVNDAPTAADDAAETDEDASVDIDVAANDSDVDDGLDLGSVAVSGAPAHGTASADGDGTIRYTPAANFHGSDSFTYSICDNAGACDTAQVSVTVHSVPDPPRSSLALAVRNASKNGSFGTEASVGVAPNNRAQYKITYTNAGEMSATGVVIRHPIPSNSSVVSGSCSPGCQVIGGNVVFSLGEGLPGATDLYFTLAFNLSFQNATTTASGSGIEEGPFPDSNPVTVRNLCVQGPTGPVCDPF